MRNCFFILSATLFFIFGCIMPVSAQSPRYSTELDYASKGNKPIPETFNPADGILLIVGKIDQDSSEVSNSVTSRYRTDDYINHFMVRNKEKMIEYLDKNYPFKYEWAAQSEIYDSTSKYNDKNIYRYALVTSLVKRKQQIETQFYNGKEESTHHQPIFRFYIYDRLNNKTYAALGHGASAIMIAFKSAIKKISGNK